MENQFADLMKVAEGDYKIINGKKYAIELLPSSPAVDIFYNKLLPVVAPALAVWLDGSDQGDDIFAEDKNIMTNIAFALVRQSVDAEIVQTFHMLLNGATCDGVAIEYETHFKGKVGELTAVVEYAIRENFGDFFTMYLKEKGFVIPTLGQMQEMLSRQESTLPTSEEE